MNVLVVDDDVVSRMVLMHLIDGCGAFEIVEAEDGEDAWTQLAGGLRPAICFCDLRMPHLSGMELLQRIKAVPVLAPMPFVLASSAGDHDTLAQAAGLGAAGHLLKPFEGGQVRAHLAALLAGTVGGAAPTAAAAPTEAVAATLARLGIDAARLLAYLDGLQGQLGAASAALAGTIDGTIDGGWRADAHARLTRLQVGCRTLGLDGAARALGVCAAVGLASLDAARVAAALAEAAQAVTQQTAALGRCAA